MRARRRGERQAGCAAGDQGARRCQPGTRQPPSPGRYRCHLSPLDQSALLRFVFLTMTDLPSGENVPMKSSLPDKQDQSVPAAIAHRLARRRTGPCLPGTAKDDPPAVGRERRVALARLGQDAAVLPAREVEEVDPELLGCLIPGRVCDVAAVRRWLRQHVPVVAIAIGRRHVTSAEPSGRTAKIPLFTPSFVDATPRNTISAPVGPRKFGNVVVIGRLSASFCGSAPDLSQ